MSQRREKSIFISSTSQGLKPYRQLATDIVSCQDYKAVVQEHFDTPHDQLILKIKKRITDSAGVIAIVGPYYGAQSQSIRHGKPLSYTQFELLYALEGCRKPCLILHASDTFQPKADADGNLPQQSAECQEWQQAFIGEIHGFKNCGLATFRDEFEFVLALAKLRWEEWLDG